MTEKGYTCDPSKYKSCPKRHCWIVGGCCKMTVHLEYATNSEQEKEKEETECR